LQISIYTDLEEKLRTSDTGEREREKEREREREKSFSGVE
jgi:hypothetical protein